MGPQQAAFRSDPSRARLRGLLVAGEEQHDGASRWKAASRHDRGRHGSLHVAAAEAVQPAALDPRPQGIAIPIDRRHRIHVRAEGQESAAPSTPVGDQCGFADPFGAREVEAFDVEARKLRLQAISQDLVARAAARIQGDRLRGEIDGSLQLRHDGIPPVYAVRRMPGRDAVPLIEAPIRRGWRMGEACGISGSRASGMSRLPVSSVHDVEPMMPSRR